MVDAERLSRILRYVSANAARLRERAGINRAELLDDQTTLDATKWLFVTTLEGCIDAAQHICAAESFEPPGSNADAMRLLAHHGLIDADLGERMARAVGFRNVLVHRYADVDERLVVDNLDRVDDFDAFVDALARLLR